MATDKSIEIMRMRKSGTDTFTKKGTASGTGAGAAPPEVARMALRMAMIFFP